MKEPQKERIERKKLVSPKYSMKSTGALREQTQSVIQIEQKKSALIKEEGSLREDLMPNEKESLKMTTTLLEGSWLSVT